MKLKLLLPLLLIPVFAGCGQTIEKEEPVVVQEEKVIDEALVTLRQKEAIVYADENFNYFSDGSFIEKRGDKYALHTPLENVIRDTEGIVQLPSLLDTVNEHLSVRNGKVVLVKAVGYPKYLGNVAKMREEIDNVEYRDVKYSVKEYDYYDFSLKRDDDGRIAKILFSKLDPFMDKLRDEHHAFMLEQGRKERIEEEKREIASEATPAESVSSESLPLEDAPLESMEPSPTIQATVHTHVWQPVYKTVPAVTKTVYEVYDNSTKEVIAVVDSQKEADEYDNAAYRSKEEVVKEEETVIGYYKCTCGEKYSP